MEDVDAYPNICLGKAGLWEGLRKAEVTKLDAVTLIKKHCKELYETTDGIRESTWKWGTLAADVHGQ